MMNFFSRYWWVFLVRGLFAVLLGLMALLMPGITFTTIIIFLGAYLFIDGIFSVTAAIGARKTISNWGWFLASGIAGILIGLLTFYNPFATAAVLMYMIAFWALVAGVAEIAVAIRLRKEIQGEGWYIIGGLLTILFGISIFMNPVAGAITITIIFGAYALVWGITLISLGLRLRRKQKHIPA